MKVCSRRNGRQVINLHRRSACGGLAALPLASRRLHRAHSFRGFQCACRFRRLLRAQLISHIRHCCCSSRLRCLLARMCLRHYLAAAADGAAAWRWHAAAGVC